jgi:hypothetical protein
VPDLPARARSRRRDPGHDKKLLVMTSITKNVSDVCWSISANGDRRNDCEGR